VKQLVAATGNHHKLDELRALLGEALRECGIELVGLDRFNPVPPEPAESGETFEENARIKAVAYARALGEMCLADDSGLEVDALGGEPGVHSAHWAGHEGSRPVRDSRNNAKLMRAMEAVPHDGRTARFVCTMCLADRSGTILHETRGTFEGTIVDAPRGANGFGYDPFLWVPDQNCTSAELAPEVKNARSHRGHAAREMATWIRRHRSPSHPTANS